MEKRPLEVPVEKSYEAAALNPSSSPPPKPAPRWSRWDKTGDVPAPPPVWTRYIESRMRQFAEGR